MGIEKIDKIEQREFGFAMGMGEKRYMKRKVVFSTQEELDDYIHDKDPFDCYVSVAFYEHPSWMESWLGAQLFFDIDCKDNLKLAYADALTVYEVLLDDFALEEVSLRFSGSKGYHVISNDLEPRILVAVSRREICDYIREVYNVKTIDAPASADIKRLRRIAGTRNSKSGEYCRIIKMG